jgi:hypothetical protein
MSILTPETGQPYFSHVIVSFGIRPAPLCLRYQTR